MYLFAYGLALAVFAATALAPRRLRLEATREGLFPRTTEGQRLSVTLQLKANRRASTLVLEERLPQRLGQTVRVPVARIGSGQVIQHDYTLRCQRRGVYKVGPLIAVSSDPLGLATRRTIVAPEFELLVHPDIENLEDRPLTRQFEEPPIRPPVSKPWPSGHGVLRHARVLPRRRPAPHRLARLGPHRPADGPRGRAGRHRQGRHPARHRPRRAQPRRRGRVGELRGRRAHRRLARDVPPRQRLHPPARGQRRSAHLAAARRRQPARS